MVTGGHQNWLDSVGHIPLPISGLYWSAVTFSITPITTFKGYVTDFSLISHSVSIKQLKLEMWANAQRDGRPAEYKWRPLFNAARFRPRPLLECRAVTLPRRETRLVEITWGAPN